MNPSSKQSDPRMVSGAAIANVIFFDVTDMATDADGALRARLTASDRHEVWLESTGEQLRASLDFCAWWKGTLRALRRSLATLTDIASICDC